MYEFIRENIKRVRYNAGEAAVKSGRRLEDITIVAVTKNISPDMIKEAFQAGITDFGENRAQELTAKYGCVPASWHFVGHLQTNKVSSVVDKVDLIHSVDSVNLAREIDKKCRKTYKIQDILLQVNVSGECTKYGFDFSDIAVKSTDILHEISGLKGVKIRGIMSIAPNTADTGLLDNLLSKCNKLYLDMKKIPVHNVYMDFLSLGMSNDYEQAIINGSNMIRVGSAIFRESNKYS